MKVTLTIISCLLCCSMAISQITFEKGYLIKNSGERIECLIKNEDWKDNPTRFTYKLSQNSEAIETSLSKVSEFGIYESSKFKRFNIDIDRSSPDLNEVSAERMAKFKNEMLFLRVLIEGASNLFSYEDSNLKRYFYNIGQNKVEQLVYKLYKNEEGKIGYNKRYRQQLSNSMVNDCVSINQIKNINYYRKDLLNLFLKYNNCNSDFKTSYQEKKQKYDAFNLSIRPGINSSSLSINSPIAGRDAEFDNELSLRFGVEVEYVFPFNKNKWSIITEPTFQSYKSETERDAFSDPSLPLDRTFIANYKSIELPVGLRHSFFLSKTTKLFINAVYIIDFELDSDIQIGITRDFDMTMVSHPINTRSNFAFGAGTKYNKFSAEFRYSFGRKVFSNSVFWNSSYNTASLIFGYSLL